MQNRTSLAWLSWSLSLLFLLSTACKTAEKVQIDPSQRLENSLLWEIKGKGIKTSYLFGTIHMIGEKDYSFSEKAEAALDKSQRLVLEIDMSNMMQMGMQMLSLAPMQGGKKLKDLLPEKDYELVKTYFTEEATNPELKMMPFSMIENWKPMLLQSFLYQDMIEGETKAYEMELMAMAKKRNMSFGGLETIADQMNVFEKIPYKDQAQALLEGVKGLKNGDQSGKKEFAQLVELYKKADVDGLIESSSEQMEDMENSEEELLIKRNNNWIPLIKEFSKKEACFYAVGAAHLGGPHGVIRLLRKEGYQLTPIDIKD